MNDEAGYQKRLRKELELYSILSFVTEKVMTGFPDILLSFPDHGGMFLLELKVSDSSDIKDHSALPSKTQLYWLARLSHAFLLVFVHGDGAYLYRVNLDMTLSIVRHLATTPDLICTLEEMYES